MMLCLKPEALDEDQHPQCPNGNGDCNGGNNEAFVLPINWGSSINRYLQWKSGKVWSKSFSAELEERSGQETSQQMCDYKYQLGQEVRIFRPENTSELLKRSMKDCIQASVGISNKGKVLVPKLLHGFAKGVVEDSVLPEWICRFVSPQQASMVRNCVSHSKWRLLGARVFSVVPFDSRFRFLFLLDDSK